jgi:alcohol dehydrogenase
MTSTNTTIDSTAVDVGQALQRLGGVTVPGYRGKLKRDHRNAGRLLYPSVSVQLISPAPTITGHPAGTAADIEAPMNFTVLSGIRAQVKERPLDDAPHACAAMEDGHARHRTVLTI